MSELRIHSTITQHRRLAEVFSHKPTLVCIEDDGTIQHDGRLTGKLYRVEQVRAEDIIPHLTSSMEPGMEWVTTRPLPLTLLGPVPITQDESITDDRLAALRNRAKKTDTMASSEFHLRPFSSDDQVAVRSLILEGLGERWGFIDETCNPDLNDISATYIEHGHQVIVAEDKNGIIGTGTLVVNGTLARMVRVSVRRSKRTSGIGCAIVKSLMQCARERGVHRIEVETNLDWFSAIRLYEKHGFTEYIRDDESVYLALERV
ncbi:MAG TPA: GNAT family N-acetyltransferase [Anaerolineae bacterium]